MGRVLFPLVPSEAQLIFACNAKVAHGFKLFWRKPWINVVSQVVGAVRPSYVRFLRCCVCSFVFFFLKVRRLGRDLLPKLLQKLPQPFVVLTAYTRVGAIGTQSFFCLLMQWFFLFLNRFPPPISRSCLRLLSGQGRSSLSRNRQLRLRWYPRCSIVASTICFSPSGVILPWSFSSPDCEPELCPSAQLGDLTYSFLITFPFPK